MIERITIGDVTWVDLSFPTKEEIREVMNEYNIHPRMSEALISPSYKRTIDAVNDAIYLVLHFPVYKHTHTTTNVQEVDFIIKQHVLITTHYDSIDALHKFKKEIEVLSATDDRSNGIGTHAGYLFYHLVRKLYKSVQHELEYLDTFQEQIEAQVFAGKEREMVEKISEVSRNLLNFRQSLRAHDQMLEALANGWQKVFTENMSYHLETLYDKSKEIEETTTHYLESIKELRETNNSLLYTKQNEVMQILTILAFVTFPLSLVAGIFGMNTEFTPVVGSPNDFWTITIIMGGLTALFFAYFKFRRWL